MAYFQLLVAQIAIGAAAIFARYALTGAGPIVTSALRLSIAAVPMLALAAMSRRVRIGWRREAALALAGGMLAIHFASWIGSLQYTAVAISTLLVTTTPLFTESYDSIRLRRPPSRSVIISLALAATGLVLIASPGSAAAPIAGHAGLGIGLALTGAIAMAIYFVLVRSAGIAPRDGPPLSTSPIVARTFTWSALLLLAASVLWHEAPPALTDRTAWFGILGMGLVSQLLGHTGLNAALKTFSPTVVSSTTLLEPVVAAVLAALLFSEALHPAVIAGGLLVLAAVAIALRQPSAPEFAT